MPPKCNECGVHYNYDTDCKCPKPKAMEVVVNTNLTFNVMAVDYADAIRQVDEVEMPAKSFVEADTWEVQKVFCDDKEITE